MSMRDGLEVESAEVAGRDGAEEQLREQLDDLRAEAFVIRTLSEVLGHPAAPAPAPRPRRHLRSV